MTTKTTATKKAPFSWNKENLATATDLYLACIEETDLATANSKAELTKIAEKIGAKSAQSIRSKLTNAKIYTKCEDAPTASSAKQKPTKVSLVRNIESILNADRDSLDTLDKANAPTLEALTALILALGSDQAIEQAYDLYLIEAEAEAQAEAEAEAEAEEVNDLVNAE